MIEPIPEESNTVIRSLFVACLLLATASAHAAGARAQLDAFANGLDALAGSFVQEVRDADGREVETSNGTLALKAPRQFRWAYEAPFPQLIVADGLNVWIYDEDLAQVTVRGQSLAESQSPLTVLTDLSLLDRDYTTSEPAPSDGVAWLRLVSRAEEPPFRHCDLGFTGNQLVRMVLVDALGQRNEIRFGPWQRNPQLAADTFVFTPPDGVDVVGEPVDGAQAFPVQD
jgi:outer membrane lipoprotein carrier protein